MQNSRNLLDQSCALTKIAIRANGGDRHNDGDILMETGEYDLTQEDGSFPTILAGGSARGESGVSVLSLRFLQGLHFKATTQQHLVWFQSPVRVRSRGGDGNGYDAEKCCKTNRPHSPTFVGISAGAAAPPHLSKKKPREAGPSQGKHRIRKRTCDGCEIVTPCCEDGKSSYGGYSGRLWLDRPR
jgi:hypothetical protein